VTTVSIGAHELSACPIPDGGPTDSSPFRLSLTALGPFPATSSDVERDLGLDAQGQSLAFNAATIGVDAVAANAPADSGGAFIGHSERRHDNRIDVLLWPEQTACPVVEPAENGYPGANAGQALGFSPRTGVVLVAGENAADGRAGTALTFDTETGAANVVPRESGTLRVSRAFATVTEFGDGLLVAGGTNPFEDAAAEDASRTAEVYRPLAGGFDPTLIELWSRRTRHAALTLPATGETLLVGGLAPDPASTRPGELIRQLEAVSPATRSSSITLLAALALGRVDPAALVLQNGRLFVGGGYNVGTDPNDPRGEPIGQIEWFLPDATSRLFYAELPARNFRTFASLPGGAVLSVASCSGEQAAQRADCACFGADGTPCKADDSGGAWVDAWWIDPDGTPSPVAFTFGTAFTPCATPDQPLLVAGSDGAPWLVSAHTDGTPACLWRFEAWPELLTTTPSNDPATRPRFVMTKFELDPSPDPGSLPLSFGADAFAWVGPSGGMFGARFGQRGPLTRDLLLMAPPPGSRFRPAHLVPDRDPSASHAAGDDPAVVFEQGNGRLTLRPAAPVVTLWVTDTLYDAIAISIAVDPASDAPTPALPALSFGNATGATADCTWPDLAASNSTGTSVTITAQRTHTRVTLSAPGVADSTCEVPDGPLAVGLHAASAATTLRSLDVTRLLLE
jgi:hypothetical protein